MVRGTHNYLLHFSSQKNQNVSLSGGHLTLEDRRHEDSGTLLSITCDVEVVESDVVSVLSKSKLKSLSGSRCTSVIWVDLIN